MNNLQSGFNYAGIGITLVIDCAVDNLHSLNKRADHQSEYLGASLGSAMWIANIQGYWGDLMCEDASVFSSGTMLVTHFMVYGSI